MSGKSQFIASQAKHLAACNQRGQSQVWQGSALNDQHAMVQGTSKQPIHEPTYHPMLLHRVIVAKDQHKMLRDLAIERAYQEIKEAFPVLLARCCVICL